MNGQTTQLATREESLDPDEWNGIRQLGHQMLDDMMDYLETVRARPVWKKIPNESIRHLQEPLPLEPTDLEVVYEEFKKHVLPYNKNNIHPRFWAWVEGGGTPAGMLADLLASGMNANLAIGNHAPVYVEKQVIEWSKEIFGFPASASGLVTSGASIANITALLVARNHQQEQIRRRGLHELRGQLVAYGSSESHHCLIKGVEAIGIGSDHFRKIPVDRSYRIRTDSLQQAIIDDKLAGLIPFCIVGNAGTVNTGATDDLRELAQIALEEKLWFHIDGAFGAVASLLPEMETQFSGMASADSLSFDFHKWFYMNYEVGCVLIRQAGAHRAAFDSSANYLLAHERGLSAGPDPFSNYGMELSRGFKALKVWMLLKEHGIRRYERLVRKNIAQAAYLGSLVNKNECLELLAEVSLNIVCYRFNPGQLDEARLNMLNKEIHMRLAEEGIASTSYTLLNGTYAIRVAITNHRSQTKDFDELIRATCRIGHELIH
jgi:aromatic-L-amino-acid decarboxylase